MTKTVPPAERADAMRRVLNGETLEKVAAELGITRAAMSLWFIEAGTPLRELRGAKTAQRDAFIEARKLVKRLELAERNERITTALTKIADEYNVTPYTLAQWAYKNGPYGIKRKPRRDARLPDRYSPEGDALAAQVIESTKPLNARHVAHAMLKGKM